MTTEVAFLDDIREHPDEDAPRLIFADWLEDTGQPDRARFIRLRLQASHLAPGDMNWIDCNQQASLLLRDHWHEWVGPLVHLIGRRYLREGWMIHGFRPNAIEHLPRGFVSSLEIDAPRYLDIAAYLFDLAPVNHLILQQAGEVPQSLAGCNNLNKLQALTFNDYWRAPLASRGLSILARTARLDRLRHLRLYANDIGDSGIEALADAPWLGHLETLDLRKNWVTGRGIEFLCHPGTAFRPARLHLGINPIDDGGVKTLAESPLLEHVEHLDLSHGRFGSIGVEALIRSPYLSRLNAIDLRGNNFDDSTRQMLTSSWLCQRLQVVQVSPGS